MEQALQLQTAVDEFKLNGEPAPGPTAAPELRALTGALPLWPAVARESL